MDIEQSVFKEGEIKMEEIIRKEKEKITNFAQNFVNENFEKDPERFKKALKSSKDGPCYNFAIT